MNTKRTIPLIVALLPLLLIVGAVFLVVKWIFPAKKDTETKPETAPVNTGTGSHGKEAETALKTPAFRQIPGGIPVQPAVVPFLSVRVPVVAPPVPPAAKVPSLVPSPVVVPVIKTVVQMTPPPPIKKKFVTRDDMANVFQHGARALNRTAAVEALKRLGFGKTAAYAALSPDGRFSSWLQSAPDGIITWSD
jgi:hypothetical protein